MDVKRILIYGLFIVVIATLAMLLLGGKASDSESLFNKYLMSSRYVYILMDAEGADNLTATNIFQCGVDFAGSLGGFKVVNVYAISKDGKCYAGGHPVGKYNCLDKLGSISSDPVIYIKKGTNAMYVGNIAYVGVNKTYKMGSCSVNVR